MKTMTRREWAISKGLAKPTRGRMSREAHAECDRAEKAGEVSFSSPVKPVTVKAETTEQKEPEYNPYSPTAPQRRAAETYSAVFEGTKIVKGNRDVCARCRISLGWCLCDGPYAWAPDTKTMIALSPGG